MDDVDGPEVASVIYGQLFAPGKPVIDSDVIPYALNLAIQKLRERGLSANRWAPYVHIGT